MSAQQQTSKFFMPIEYKEEQKTWVPTDWNSVFIPSLPSQFTNENTLKYLAEEVFKFGSVKRVDIIKKENATNRLMAFIHFNHWYDNVSVSTFRQKMDKDGLVDVFGFIDHNKQRMNYTQLLDPNIKRDTFLRFLINKTPIKETELNIHQLADVLEKAEKKLSEQELLIQELQAELVQKQLKIDNLTFVLQHTEKTVIGVSMRETRKRLSNPSLVDEGDNVSEMGEYLEKPKLVREQYIQVQDDVSMFAMAESQSDSVSYVSLF